MNRIDALRLVKGIAIQGVLAGFSLAIVAALLMGIFPSDTMYYSISAFMLIVAGIINAAFFVVAIILMIVKAFLSPKAKVNDPAAS